MRKGRDLRETREEEYWQERNEPIYMEGYRSLQEWCEKETSDLTAAEAEAEGITIDEEGTVSIRPDLYERFVMSDEQIREHYGWTADEPPYLP